MPIYRAYFIAGPARTSWKDRLRLAAAAVIGAVVVAAALVLSLSLLFVLVPVGLLVYLFRNRILAALLRRAGVEPMSPAPPSPAEADGTVIDADYTVVDRKPR
ncbi:MAG: hypothetical protein J0H54_03375 [Rhizobiales bacterium]|nr:hypothetical protein [Hyphomicrobiales bacterium]